MSANSYMPYGVQADKCLADLRPGGTKSAGSRTSSRPASGRRLTDIWMTWVVHLFGTTRCVRCPTGHRPGIDRFIGDLIAVSNAAPGFKSEFKVTRLPKMIRQPQGVPWIPVIRRKLLTNPSQANCEWGIREYSK